MTTEVLRRTEIASVAPASKRSITRSECAHEPRCPAPYGLDRDAAQVIACHPEQGWSLLCNGVVLFDDTGDILPDGHCTHARRADLTAAALHRAA
jgi:hypothetical protein